MNNIVEWLNTNSVFALLILVILCQIIMIGSISWLVYFTNRRIKDLEKRAERIKQKLIKRCNSQIGEPK